MTSLPDRLTLRVVARTDLVPGICEIVLTDPNGAPLPDFSPGAHITVETPDGAMRRYSLINDGSNPDQYVIAIKREPDGRGGSVAMHDLALVGTSIAVEPPENAFGLRPAPRYLLIAGGIGITPILSMARHLTAQGVPFRLIYVTRSADQTAYLDEVQALPGAHVHHDHGDPARFFDFWDEFETPGPEHVYCCGPDQMMEEIRGVSGHWPEGRVQFEDFNPIQTTRADDVAFTVRLAQSGRDVVVPGDRTILEALRDAGISTISSCESGTCGTCKCQLIDGIADHRDMVLMPEEQADQIMICVSRAQSEVLVVDL